MFRLRPEFEMSIVYLSGGVNEVLGVDEFGIEERVSAGGVNLRVFSI